MVYNEVSDEIEKKAWAICSPMYNQRSVDGFCGISMKKILSNICDMLKNIINLWNAVTFKNIIAIIIIIFIMRMFKKEDTHCVIEEYRIRLYFKNYKLAIVCDKSAHKHMNSYNEEELKEKNLWCKFIRFNPDHQIFKINVLEDITRMFKNEDIETQYVIEKYRIDLYFKRYKLAIECEENSTKQVDLVKEKRRQELIEKNLVSTFIRFNPDQSGFNIIDVLSKINEFIMKEKEEQWKTVIASAVSAGLANLQVISRV